MTEVDKPCNEDENQILNLVLSLRIIVLRDGSPRHLGTYRKTRSPLNSTNFDFEEVRKGVSEYIYIRKDMHRSLAPSISSSPTNTQVLLLSTRYLSSLLWTPPAQQSRCVPVTAYLKTENVVAVMRNADSSTDWDGSNAIWTSDLEALLRNDRFPNTPQPLIQWWWLVVMRMDGRCCRRMAIKPCLSRKFWTPLSQFSDACNPALGGVSLLKWGKSGVWTNRIGGNELRLASVWG